MRRGIALFLLFPAMFASVFNIAILGNGEPAPQMTEPTMVVESIIPTEVTEPVIEVTVPTETVAPITELIIPETEPPTEPATEPPTEAPTEPTSGWVHMGTFKLTAYCSCQKCCGKYALNRPLDENGVPVVYTASGARAEVGVTIAVDPRVIPYGTQVRLNGHIYIAQDTGGSIKGNRIDVYFADHQEALNFGVQYADVEIFKE